MINVGGVKVARLLPNRLVTTQGKPGSRTLYLTFDDGPDPKYTIPVCDMLQRLGVKATFFCIGDNLEKYPDIARYAASGGHLLANHSMHHRSFRKLSLAEQLREAEDCQKLIFSIAGDTRRIFRAPQGQLSIPLLVSLKQRHWDIVHWSADSLDYRQMPLSEQLAVFEERPVVDGDILLFHDDSQLAIDILERMLPRWLAEGYRFSTVLDLVT